MLTRTIAAALFLFLLAACSGNVAPTIAPADTAPTALPVAPTDVPTAAPTEAPASAMDAESIAAGLIAAGLPVREGKGKMGPDDYGLAPYLCDGWHFYVTDVPDDDTAGGRVFVCADPADADALASYYGKLGKASAMLYSHVWRNEPLGVIVQANGEVPEADAALFAAHVAALK